MATASLSRAQARRIVLAAQGFARPRPDAVGTRQLTLAIARLGLLQLDSVNVFERSHYLPLFARLGSYDRAQLDRLTFARQSRYTEYWAHEAALIPIADRPLWAWKMAALRERDPKRYPWPAKNGAMLDWLRAELAEKGPLAASEIEHDANRRSGPWWGWSDVKQGLEFLFRWGEVVSAGRTRFERTYALPHHVLPAEVLAREVPRADAQRELVAKAAEALGVGTVSDLADYFRLSIADTRAAVLSLEREGVLEPVTVEGTERPAWLHRDARRPRAIDAVALLSPFDPVVWDRSRAERLFDFHYRIEIYTPAPKRIYGYYSLPILVDDAIVGRIDLKSDRKPGVLRVQSAWHEPGVSTDVAERIAPVLKRAAEWQGLESIEVADRGTLASAVRSALR